MRGRKGGEELEQSFRGESIALLVWLGLFRLSQEDGREDGLFGEMRYEVVTERVADRLKGKADSKK